MAREQSGWERPAAIASVGLSSLLAVPLVVAVATFATLSSTLDACEELDSGPLAVGPSDAGVSAGADGEVVVRPGPCRSAVGFASVRVTAADGSTVWLADATGDGDGDGDGPSTARRFAGDRLVIGRAPAGFDEVVPLAAPLDPTATYTVDLALLTSTTASSMSPTSLDPAGDIAELGYTTGGQSATFRPADLSPATVSYRGDTMDPAAFADLACGRSGGS